MTCFVLAVIGKNHQLLSPVEKPTISRKPIVVTNQEENTNSKRGENTQQ
jgi:hypothetical protein